MEGKISCFNNECLLEYKLVLKLGIISFICDIGF